MGLRPKSQEALNSYQMFADIVFEKQAKQILHAQLGGRTGRVISGVQWRSAGPSSANADQLSHCVSDSNSGSIPELHPVIGRYNAVPEDASSLADPQSALGKFRSPASFLFAKN